MKRSVLRICVAALLILVFGVSAAAQMKEGYLDAYIVQVKPEKRAEFDVARRRPDHPRAVDAARLCLEGVGHRRYCQTLSTKALIGLT